MRSLYSIFVISLCHFAAHPAYGRGISEFGVSSLDSQNPVANARGFQEAMNWSAGSSTQDPRCISVPDGVYLISDTLRTRAPVCIVGKDWTIKYVNNDSPKLGALDAVLTITYGYTGKIQGLRIDGQNLVTNGLFLSGNVINFTLRDIRVKNIIGAGFLIDYAQGGLFENLQVVGSSIGSAIRPKYGVLIGTRESQNTVPSNGNIFKNLLVKHVLNAGIKIFNGTDNTFLQGKSIENKYGVFCEGSGDNNDFFVCQGNAFLFFETKSNAQNDYYFGEMAVGNLMANVQSSSSGGIHFGSISNHPARLNMIVGGQVGPVKLDVGTSLNRAIGIYVIVPDCATAAPWTDQGLNRTDDIVTNCGTTYLGQKNLPPFHIEIASLKISAVLHASTTIYRHLDSFGLIARGDVSDPTANTHVFKAALEWSTASPDGALRCVLIPDEMFEVSEPLTASGSACLIGKNWTLKYVKPTRRVGSSDALIMLSSGHGGKIQGLTIDGQGLISYGLSLVGGVVNYVLRDVRVTNVSSAGFLLDNVQGGLFENLQVSRNIDDHLNPSDDNFSTPVNGLIIGSENGKTPSQGNSFVNIAIEHVSDAGIRILSGANNSFVSGTSEGNRYGFYCGSGCQKNIFASLDTEENPDADYYFSGASNNLILNANSSSKGGIRFATSEGQPATLNAVVGGLTGPMSLEPLTSQNRAVGTYVAIPDCSTRPWVDEGHNQTDAIINIICNNQFPTESH